MELPTGCPTCTCRLEQRGEHLVCSEGHSYTSLGLALASNLTAVNALWRAIRALEDDAAGLEWSARRAADAGDASTAGHHEADAAAGREAARSLRVLAEQTQQRLDALPVAPSRALEDQGRQGQS